MASIDGISLDGAAGAPAEGAVALALAAPPRRTRLRRFAADGWEVELRSGKGHVVARTRSAMPREALLASAIDTAHRALDLASVEDNDHLATVDPADGHVGLSRERGRTVVWHQDVSDLNAGVEGTAQLVGADGKVVPRPAVPPLDWAPAFRFYRLSQNSRDPFEAFRNLFLSLEALLDQFFPIGKTARGKKEHEKDWLRRAIAEASAKVDLAALAPAGSADPVNDLLDPIYDIRIQLFHAKTGRTLVPEERANHLAVAQVYPKLVGLWNAIARSWIPLHRGGGAFTREGFKMLVEPAMSRCRIAVTADATPVDKTDESMGTRGLPVHVLPSPPAIVEIRPGCLALRGCVEVTALPRGQIVGRIGVVMEDGRPVMAGSIVGGLALEGADVFETTMAMRLVNRSLPRTEFS